MPPRRRTASAVSATETARPASTPAARYHDAPSARPAHAARASAAITRTAAQAALTLPATSAPRPPGLAAGTGRLQATVIASLDVTAAVMIASGPRPRACARASALTWISS